jgi:pathogenesis-related protein 1
MRWLLLSQEVADMKSSLLLLPFLAVAPMAQAVYLDCLFISGNEMELAGAPANWHAAIERHNCARRTALPVPNPRLGVLVWNTTLATTAQNWANNCQYAHNSSPYGENIYAGALSSGFPTNVEIAATNDWAAEISSYNYAANTCSADCGHYTQMVWRSSTQIGCGIRQCTTNSPFPPPFNNWTFVVCNYNPPGNNGQRPY